VRLSDEDRSALKALRRVAERDAVAQPVVSIDKSVLRWLLDLVDEASTAPANRLVAQWHAAVDSWEKHNGRAIDRPESTRILDTLLAAALRSEMLLPDEAIQVLRETEVTA
jgi:hypothetical protein